MDIARYIDIQKELRDGKTLVLLGPRRVGKTTLLNLYLKDRTNAALFRGDDLSTQEAFKKPDARLLKSVIGSAKILAIDEAQAIPNAGQSLKIINDTMPELKVVVTGSSSFELAGQVGEPLTGRKITRYLLPISVNELLTGELAPRVLFSQLLPQLLVYGMYPNAITANTVAEKSEFLRELVDSYLLRDILTYQEIKGSQVLLQLLVLLAYQIGNEVSLNELGSSLGIDKNTVAKYLDLLEKSYIIFKLGSFSKNLRKEVSKSSKYYFYDVGVRNAIINNFNDLELRNDAGHLWENFIIVERLKHRLYTKLYANQYFWRTWRSKSEIDLIEERAGKLYGYEMKWKSKKVTRPKEWFEAYPNMAMWELITPDNALEFLNLTSE